MSAEEDRALAILKSAVGAKAVQLHGGAGTPAPPSSYPAMTGMPGATDASPAAALATDRDLEAAIARTGAAHPADGHRQGFVLDGLNLVNPLDLVKDPVERQALEVALVLVTAVILVRAAGPVVAAATITVHNIKEERRRRYTESKSVKLACTSDSEFERLVDQLKARAETALKEANILSQTNGRPYPGLGGIYRKQAVKREKRALDIEATIAAMETLRRDGFVIVEERKQKRFLLRSLQLIPLLGSTSSQAAVAAHNELLKIQGGGFDYMRLAAGIKDANVKNRVSVLIGKLFSAHLGEAQNAFAVMMKTLKAANLSLENLAA